jgi:hypothetical protein
MNRTRDDLYLRSDLIGKVQRGRLSPEEAEAEAKALGIGELAAEPDTTTAVLALAVPSFAPRA